MWQETLTALEETIFMVFTSGLIAALVGIPLGIILCVTKKNHILANSALYNTLSTIVNALRSIPYIILMIAIIPLTRLITGTSIGTVSSIVPLSLAAIPFVAKLAETSLSKVESGLIEAAKACGATPMQIITKILLPESKYYLTHDMTVTLVNLIGYSAMAGAMGGGGLGSLAIHYGYQRFNITVMLTTIIILIALVQLIQYTGDTLALKIKEHKL